MPTTEWNLVRWDQRYHWNDGGDIWSKAWGSVEMHWHATLLPRIHRYVPAESMLEIAPGYGRWTAFLKDLCSRLSLVDLSPKCIEACRKRFGESDDIAYHVNDGRSLEMIDDDSIDFAFSFDSLVHVELEVLESYLRELCSKLRKDGVGMFHHSNAGEYARYFKVLKRVPLPKSWLRLIGIGTRRHARALSVTAEGFDALCRAAGLRCLSQEIINWHGPLLLDCISIFVREDSSWPARCERVRNRHFMNEADSASRISALYGGGEGAS